MDKEPQNIKYALFFCSALTLAALAVFRQVSYHKFINFDDNRELPE